MNLQYLLVLCFRLSVLFFCGMIILVILQDLLIFPFALTSLIRKPNLKAESLQPPPRVTFLQTEDKEVIELWKLEKQPSAEKPYVALLFHGNGGWLADFYFFQKWLSSLGLTSYSFDYRGYGRSTGWPSEKGIYLDAEAVWQQLTVKDNISPENIIVVGWSIGSGPAAYIAKKYQPKALMLISPYSSIYEVAITRPIIGLAARLFKPFLFYDFPVANYVSELNNTCLIIAHGQQDDIINFENSLRVKKAFTGEIPAQFIHDDIAGHNDLFDRIKNQLAESIQNCIRLENSLTPPPPDLQTPH